MRLSWLVEGIAIGALGMYFFDPNRGRRRRVEMRDRTVRRMNRMKSSLNIMGRDFYNRAKGVTHQVSHFRSRNDVSDEVLCERVRSSLGRCVTHPGAIQVSSSNGHLTLSGDILANEIEEAVHTAKRVAGKKKVVNELRQHGRHDGFPGLQGEGHIAEPSDRWTPALSLVMCVLGAGIAIRGLRRGDGWGGGMAALGTAMVVKGFSDTEHRHQSTTSKTRRSGSRRTTGDAYGEPIDPREEPQTSYESSARFESNPVDMP